MGVLIQSSPHFSRWGMVGGLIAVKEFFEYLSKCKVIGLEITVKY